MHKLCRYVVLNDTVSVQDYKPKSRLQPPFFLFNCKKVLSRCSVNVAVVSNRLSRSIIVSISAELPATLLSYLV